MEEYSKSVFVCQSGSVERFSITPQRHINSTIWVHQISSPKQPKSSDSINFRFNKQLTMVFSRPASESDLYFHSNFASRYARDSLPRYKHNIFVIMFVDQKLILNYFLCRFSMPENSMPKDSAYQNIHDELQLDGIPKLNLASFVTTSMEEECNKLIMESINKNYVDMDEYPVTTELHVISLLSLSHFTCSKCTNIYIYI